MTLPQAHHRTSEEFCGRWNTGKTRKAPLSGFHIGRRPPAIKREADGDSFWGEQAHYS